MPEVSARPAAAGERSDAVLVVGGTTSALLKLAAELTQRRPWSLSADGFQVPLLIVDEASMMVFPHFLALASLVHTDGDIMLTGDHRQLAPILAHDWEHEDSPVMDALVYSDMTTGPAGQRLTAP